MRAEGHIKPCLSVYQPVQPFYSSQLDPTDSESHANRTLPESAETRSAHLILFRTESESEEGQNTDRLTPWGRGNILAFLSVIRFEDLETASVAHRMFDPTRPRNLLPWQAFLDRCPCRVRERVT